MPAKLHEVIAVLQGKKTAAQRMLTDAHHGWKDPLLTGISRIYTPVDDEGETRPPESKKVQVSVKDTVQEVIAALIPYWDLAAAQEATNQKACADVVVESGASAHVVLQKVPVAVLLFLERQLGDLHTFGSELPILPGDRDWRDDPNRGCYVSESVKQNSTHKVEEPIVLYDATPEHPAQTQLITKDVVVGQYTTTHLSGAIPADAKKRIVSRIQALQEAVKRARERANGTEEVKCEIGKVLLDYVFGAQVESK